MTVSLDELIRYWLGELPPEREAEVEEAVFEDPLVEARLDALVGLERLLRDLIVNGQLQAGLTVEAVEELSRAGLSLRTYVVDAGETVPCTIAAEDLVVIRLRGDFSESERVSVVMEGSFDGMPPASERYEDVAVDRRAGEVVLVYPGDRIRALPRSRFVYSVRSADRAIGQFGLDHTPPL